MSAFVKQNGDNPPVSKMPLITNIQRYSLQDGPGIRTTVFVKGCPLRCPWCHNPETQSTKVEINYYVDKCIGCARCAEFCPTGAAYVERIGEDAFIRFDRIKCIGCGKCAEVCITGARERVGNKLTLDEIIKEAVADRLFFINSGGGVTISGGEPLYFPEFTVELAKKLKQELVHVAVETSAFCQWRYLNELREYIDLFLVDIKTMDPRKYKEVINGNCEVIFTNIENLVNYGANIRIRLPIIPNFNNTIESYEAYVKYLSNLTAKIAVDILPFHSYGESKYKLLGRLDKYEYSDVNSMSNKDVMGLVELFIHAGFEPGLNITVGGVIGVGR